MIQKCKIILITVFVVIFITGCDSIYTKLKDPHQTDWYLNIEHSRLENLLKELLIEMQETNATLKRIEDRLDRTEYD